LKAQFDIIGQYELLDNPLQVPLFTGYADVFSLIYFTTIVNMAKADKN